MTTYRAITKFAELDTRKFYEYFTDMAPAEAAAAYQRKYGHAPVEVLTFGPHVYIQSTRPIHHEARR